LNTSRDLSTVQADSLSKWSASGAEGSGASDAVENSEAAQEQKVALSVPGAVKAAAAVVFVLFALLAAFPLLEEYDPKISDSGLFIKE
jgi:hypothetical protein